jgi:aquaporin Z
MRVMPIRIVTGKRGWEQMKTSFKKNWKHYLQEASGLGIFMVSACFFGGMLFSEKSPLYHTISNEMMRNVWMSVAMGATALFIFYSPWTSPSGSQINPAVTITFLRLDKMCRYDALFFIIFQIIGGTVAVYIMQLLMRTTLTEPPVNSVATFPGKAGMWWALITEFITAFITMSMVLFTSNHKKLKKFTRIFAGCLVCIWVMVAGPISGFGMNPARSFASALPSGIWAAFWIYLFIPIAGMLTATELYLLLNRKSENKKYKGTKAIAAKKKNFEPFEFVL